MLASMRHALPDPYREPGTKRARRATQPAPNGTSTSVIHHWHGWFLTRCSLYGQKAGSSGHHALCIHTVKRMVCPVPRLVKPPVVSATTHPPQGPISQDRRVLTSSTHTRTTGRPHGVLHAGHQQCQHCSTCARSHSDSKHGAWLARDHPPLLACLAVLVAAGTTCGVPADRPLCIKAA